MKDVISHYCPLGAYRNTDISSVTGMLLPNACLWLSLKACSRKKKKTLSRVQNQCSKAIILSNIGILDGLRVTSL